MAVIKYLKSTNFDISNIVTFNATYGKPHMESISTVPTFRILTVGHQSNFGNGALIEATFPTSGEFDSWIAFHNELSVLSQSEADTWGKDLQPSDLNVIDNTIEPPIQISTTEFDITDFL